MAFLEKLSGVAKDAKEKAGEAVEITKLKAKIGREKNEIGDILQKIGEHFMDRFLAGEELDSVVNEMCKEIAEHNKTIEELLEQIAEIKD